MVQDALSVAECGAELARASPLIELASLAELRETRIRLAALEALLIGDDELMRADYERLILRVRARVQDREALQRCGAWDAAQEAG